jgi:hypothetical protein
MPGCATSGVRPTLGHPGDQAHALDPDDRPADVHELFPEVHIIPGDAHCLADPDTGPEQEASQVGQVLAHRVRIGVQDRQPSPTLLRGQRPGALPITTLKVAYVPNRIRPQAAPPYRQATDPGDHRPADLRSGVPLVPQHPVKECVDPRCCQLGQAEATDNRQNVPVQSAPI